MKALSSTEAAGLQRPVSRAFGPGRVIDGVLALAAAVAGLWLAGHYPLSGMLALLLWVACAAGVYARPTWWPAVLPAVLPVLGLMTWTGWIVVEEIDLLVLAIAAGGYARLALGWAASEPDPRPIKLRGLALLAYAVALLLSMQRGVDDAGGWVFGWWQGYHEPLNSLRLAKSFFLALLLLPLWRAAVRVDEAGTLDRLRLGLLAGLGAVSVVALWERIAFPGLLNFSTDYRTTAAFWEMHVGGAALDGFLALTIPFAAASMMRARSNTAWLAAGAVVMLAVYASLTTFSRVLFVALPVGLAVLFALEGLRRRRAAGAAPDAPRASAGTIPGVLLVLGFGLAASSMFPSSGWRGMLALLGAAAVLLPLAGLLPTLPKRSLAAGLLGGLLLGSGAAAAESLHDKGAYIAYVLAFLLCALMLWRARSAGSAEATANLGLQAPAWVLAGFVALLAGVLLVGQHWGEAAGLRHAWPATALMLALVLAASRVPQLSWPRSVRWQGTVLAAMATAGALVGAFSGGDYISQRINTGNRDAMHRVQHWKHALSWLNGPADWALGKGLGRYPANHLLSGTADEPPGDYRLITDEQGARHMALTGGRHDIDWGQILRLSQRVSPPGPKATVRLRARTERPVGIHVEVCEKNLLYHGTCIFGNVELQPGDRGWQTLTLPMVGERITGGPWWTPRPVVFSIGLLTRGGRVEIDDLHLDGEKGQPLLRNGDFADGMAGWYFSSDHHHMPWHLKSLPLHLLFEQGWVGLGLLAALSLAALVRISVGGAREHPLAPVIAASMVGFFIVGTIDSLLDVPRLALLYYLLLLVALTLPLGRSAPRGKPVPPAKAPT